MPTVTYNSSAPVAIPVGIPSLVTDDIIANVTEYTFSTLSAIYIELTVVPPAEGSYMLDIFVGPSTEPNSDNLTCLHNSFQGSLPLDGITYPTTREVYSLPLSHWVSLATNPMTWRLWVYNWSEANTGTVSSWGVKYAFGTDYTPPVVPLNPIERNLGQYYGVGSNVRKDILYTLKEVSAVDGVVGFVFPVDAGVSHLRNVCYSARNFDVSEVTMTVVLIRNRSGVETTVWSGEVVAPVGLSRSHLGTDFGTFLDGDRLYFKVTSTTSTSLDFVIQATMSGE